jgi:hypothetical protein
LSTGYCCATNDGISFVIFIKKRHTIKMRINRENAFSHYKYLLNRLERNRQRRTSRQKSRSSSNNVNEFITISSRQDIFKNSTHLQKEFGHVEAKVKRVWIDVADRTELSCCVLFYLITWLFYNEKFDQN